MERLLAEPALRGARVSVLVSREGGEEILDNRAARPMVPASSLKIVTAAAALAFWGPTHHFETPVLADGELGADGVLHGDLWLVGRGDPSLVSEQLWKLAEDLRLTGLREVRGSLGIDSTYFDDVRWHPDWGKGERRAYQAPVSAFTANYSSFRIEVAPGPQPGDPLRLDVAPRVPYFRVEPGGRTLARRGRLRLELAPNPDGTGETVRVVGSLRAGEEARTYWRSVSHPDAYAAAIVRAQLEAHGVKVRGATRFGTAPDGARELMRFKGESLGRIVWKLNKFSNNFIAEQLTKGLGAARFGAPGSWSKGRKALVESLEAVGGTEPGETLADGSGLSAHNRLSARTLVRLLRSTAKRFDYGPEFIASLPLGGLDGTLEDRLEGEDVTVRAKTGHLNGVSSLCGVVPTDTGEERLIFAVIVNGARASSEDVDAALDRFVVGLAAGIVGEDQGAVGAETLAKTFVAYTTGSARPPRMRRSIAPGPQLYAASALSQVR
jgi:D-alanyl-D-alanine carboxypeptidase/D-alanyl-D-alanine-endopeptidase (penicillin-binding protein 4)